MKKVCLFLLCIATLLTLTACTSMESPEESSKPKSTTNSTVPTITEPSVPVHIHTWQEATCLVPKTCSDCGAVEGSALAHAFVDYVCTTCGQPYASEGVVYQLSQQQDSYAVLAMGSCTDTQVVIPNTYNGLPVTEICDGAFWCSHITSIIIPDSVTTIGARAFYGCESLTRVVFRTELSQLVSIGEYAFSGCLALEFLSLGLNVEYIDAYAFENCIALQDLGLNDNLKQIGDHAFQNCQSLVSITLPDHLDVLGEYAFSGCQQLTTVEFGTLLQTIGAYAFECCPQLQNVQFNNNLTHIGDYAFRACGITSLSIPNSVIRIGAAAFADCAALADVHLGSGLQNIGVGAFKNTAFVNNATAEILCLDGWVITCKNKEIYRFTLPSGIYGIAGGAFRNCYELEMLQLTGIKHVGDYAFYDCQRLYEIQFDNALLTLGDGVFSGCPFLIYVNLGRNLTTMGSYCFYDCYRLLDMDLPDSLMSMGAECFTNTYAYTAAKDIVYVDDWAVGMKSIMIINQIEIQEGTRGIADYAFREAMFMGTGVMLPRSLKIIGEGAFYNCSMLGGIGWYDVGNLTYIGNYAFYGCQSLWFTTFDAEGNATNSIGVTDIPNGVTYIGSYAFYNCGAMIGVTIPDSVQTIGDYAFYGCINMGDSGQVYASMEAMQNGEDPLKGDVILGANVKHIGVGAFQSCSGIVQVVIPKSVVYISAHAFADCTKLTTLIFEGTMEEWNNIAKELGWNKNMPATEVICSDGTISL